MDSGDRRDKCGIHSRHDLSPVPTTFAAETVLDAEYVTYYFLFDKIVHVQESATQTW